MHEVLIALGANLGDVEITFSRACGLLASDLLDARMSRVYRTEPVYDKPGAAVPATPAPAYGNAVLRAKTFWEPEPLLVRLLEVERVLGRMRPAPPCAPRTLDLDLLLYDDAVIAPKSADGLEIPHPRMHRRAFVMQPACDVAPDWVHPVLHRTLREIWDDIRGE